MAQAFRFNAQKVFLTYSQTPKRFTPQIVLKHISQKAEVSEYLISQEQHKDGGSHIHAYVKFTEKLDTKNVAFFDLEYYGKPYHPNIQKVTKVHRLWEYIKKDKNFITNIEETRPPWKVILEDSSNLEEALTQVMWNIARMDNYAGYRTFRDLLDIKLSGSPEKERGRDAMKSYLSRKTGGDQKVEE